MLPHKEHPIVEWVCRGRVHAWIDSQAASHVSDFAGRRWKAQVVIAEGCVWRYRHFDADYGKRCSKRLQSKACGINSQVRRAHTDCISRNLVHSITANVKRVG